MGECDSSLLASVTLQCSPPVTPVTAVHFIHRYLLSGQGSYCHVYNCCESWKEVGSFKVLSRSNIHGIRPVSVDAESSTMDICIFGGFSLCVVNLDKTSGCIKRIGSRDVHLSDWIWDCCWLTGDDSCHCSNDFSKAGPRYHLVAALGHNSAVQFCWWTGSILKHVHCSESCILYSAKLLNSSWSQVVFAAGTVFNQVVLWQVCDLAHSDDRIPVACRLIGHQGVITAIDYNHQTSTFCTASDDRSIRVWKSPQGSAGVQNLKSAEYEEVNVLYGHAARVWDARLLTSGIVSIGEDASCCFWTNQGEIKYKFKGHKGKSIWSLAVSSSEDMIATGGGDTSIRVWNIGLVENSMKMMETEWISSPSSVELNDFPRIVKLVRCSGVLVMFNTGCLMMYNVPSMSWHLILNNPAYSSYSVMDPDPDGKIVAIGNITGSIMLLLLSSSEPLCSVISCVEKHLYAGKVHSIHWMKVDETQSLLLTSGPNGQMTVFSVDSKTLMLTQKCDLELPLSKQRWATAAACLLPRHSLIVCGDRSGNVLVYGVDEESHGKGADNQLQKPIQVFPHIHSNTGVTNVCCHGDVIYTCGRDGQYLQYSVDSDCRLGSPSANKIGKGFDWLAQLTFVDDDLLVLGFCNNCFVVHNVNTNQRLLSVQCGGGHREWHFTMTDSMSYFTYIKKREIAICRAPIFSYQTVVSPSLHGREVMSVRHCLTHKQPLVHWFLTAGEDGHVNLISLQPNEGQPPQLRVVATTKYHISSVRSIAVATTASQCDVAPSVLVFTAGGRSLLCAWFVHINSDLDTGRFEWLASHPGDTVRNASSWKRMNIDMLDMRYMKLASFSAADLNTDFPSSHHIIISGCSDGYIRLLFFSELTRKFSVIAESSFHEHCVLQVTYFIHHSEATDHKSVFVLSAGTDGRIALWNITNIVSEFCQVQVNSERSCKSKTPSVKTFIAESDLDKLSAADVDVCATGDQVVSPSSHFQPCDTGERMLSDHYDSDVTNKCSISSCVTAKPCVSSMQPSCVVRAHQCGVNSLAVRRVPGGDRYMMVSGGDDNALAVHYVNVGAISSPVVSFCCHHLTAHNAQITGVAILSDSCLVSVSVDQRLSVWMLNHQARCSSLRHLNTILTDVADVSGVECLKHESCSGSRTEFGLVVHGIGIQFVTVRLQV